VERRVWETIGMTDPRDDLRATEQSIGTDAERLRSLEDEKARLDPADPEVARLSEQAERLTAELKEKGTAERELSEEVSGSSR
jgi:hypothetical protein